MRPAKVSFGVDYVTAVRREYQMDAHLPSEDVSAIEWRIKERRYGAARRPVLPQLLKRARLAVHVSLCVPTALRTCPRCCWGSRSSAVREQTEQLGH